MTRRYPVGIQTFSEIREGNYLYIDKTDLVWKLTNAAKYIFLSRPRRFGKSLLTTMLESYFAGRRDLFEGLNIMELEQDWQPYPVIHLDLSTAKKQSFDDELSDTLLFRLREYCKAYCIDSEKLSPGKCLESIISTAFAKDNSKVVILIDEYDAPLLDVLHEGEQLSSFKKVMQDKALKAGDADQAMREPQAILAGVPYVDGIKKKLAGAATRESFWEYSMYLILSMMNIYVLTQVHCWGGRIDMVVFASAATYVIEFKIGGTARQALEQIDTHSYADPFATAPKPVVKVGVLFDLDAWNIKEWVVSK